MDMRQGKASVHKVIDGIIMYCINCFLGVLIGALFAWGKGLAKKSHEKDEAIKQGVTATVSDSFFRMCRYLADMNEIDEDDYENFTRLYEAYRALGLNGKGEKLYNQISKKPIKFGD